MSLSAENFFAFGFESALDDRVSEIRIILRDFLIRETNEFVFTKSSILEKIDAKIKAARTIVETIEKWKTQNLIGGNPPKTKEEYRDLERQKIQITVVTISRILLCNSLSSVIGEQSATSAAAIGVMPLAIICAA